MSSWNWGEQAADEGMVHQSVTNTDHNDATKLKQGYDIANPYLSANLVGYWPLQEDSGGTAYDFSGNNNDGTITNGATVNQTGLLGTSAYSFDGTDDYVDVGTSVFGSTPNAYTVSAWSKHASVNDGDYDSVIYFRENQEFVLRDDGGGQMKFYHYNGSSYQGPATASISNGVWNLWTATWDGSTVTLYKNASSVGSFSASSGGEAGGSQSNWIGANQALGQAYLAGDVCEVRIYNVALSASEIQTLYDVVRSSGDWLGSGKVI